MIDGELRIRHATEADADQWNLFLLGCPDANFYLRYEWVRINQEELGHDVVCFMAEQGGDIAGVLPVVRVRSRIFGDILVSMPFVNFGGPAAITSEVETSLVDAACKEAERLGCDYLEIRADRPLGNLQSTTHKVSMTVELMPDPDELWKSFSTKHRKNVKKAQESQLVVRSGGIEFLDVFYQLMERGWRKLGTPLYRKSYFKKIFESFGEDARVFVAFHGEKPAAVALNGAYRGVMEGMWAAVDPDAVALQPNYVLYWEMLQYACRHGFQRFHLGRSTVGSGGQFFKSRWNAHPKQLYWNYYVVDAEGLPGLNPDHPRYQLAIRTWQRLPLSVTRVLGPSLARLIP
jgi:FemAB-related protein (PEP-CTERM system-associated)